MASRFWVNGSGTWDHSSTTNWASTSGGAPGASNPGSGDDVFFDDNSGYVTVTPSFSTYDIASLNCTNFHGTLDLSLASPEIKLHTGDCILDPAMTFMDGGGNIFSFIGSGIQFMTTNGVQMPFTGLFRDTGASTTGTLKLNGDVLCLDCGPGDGFMDLNGFNLTARYMSCGPTTSGGLILGSGTLTVGQATTLTGHGQLGGGGFFEIVGAVGSFTVTPGTGKIVLTNTIDGQPTYFNGAGKTFNNVEIGAHTGRLTEIEGSNTFNQFKISGTNMNVQFDAGTTQTVTSFVVPQNPGNQIGLCSQNSSTTQWTLSCPSGLVDAYGCAIANSNATGGAVFNAIGKGNANLGNNTGWLFEGTKKLLARSTM